MARRTARKNLESLGELVVAWIWSHCVVPDGIRQGQPFAPTSEQARFLRAHYLVKASAELGQYAAAFRYRRSQLVKPQKWGKGPLTAAQICVEGVGPVLFAGWARGGEVYDCRHFGCGCGFLWEYEPGDAMGAPWPTPLIQVTATSEEQTDNIYSALRPMIDQGPLHEQIPKTGTEFIRLPNDGRIDVVTASARSRLGQRVTFVPQDETGIWTPSSGMIAVAETQRRGLAGMGGRAVETTNCWDPAEQSVAQRTFEDAIRVGDVYIDYSPPPPHLSYRNKAERRRIHRVVYGDSIKTAHGGGWVDLDDIEAEAHEILIRDPAQAERFFGNRIVASSDAYFDGPAWSACEVQLPVSAGDRVTVGFDGSLNEDETWLRCCRVDDGYHFTPRFPDGAPMRWHKPPQAELAATWQVPRGDVHVALEHIFDTYQVARMYVDPQHWQAELEQWRARWSDRIVLPFETWRVRQMSSALEQLHTNIATGELMHDGDPEVAIHIRNATRWKRPGGVLIRKPTEDQKIDAVMADALAEAARTDVLAAGLEEPVSSSFTAY